MVNATHYEQCDLYDPPPHPGSWGCTCYWISKARKAVREEIVGEMEMRCHALGHPNPCYVCDPLIAIARGGVQQ